jgi:hypothetical protein
VSAKISATRRAAFLKALGETGNQTLAAEAAKVSRSWVQLQRSRDAGFYGECEAAIRWAKVRLRSHRERQPPKGWGYFDGAELVVRASNGRRVQVARSRLRQWTPRAEERFLKALAATCNVRAACKAVGMSVSSAHGHRTRWPAFARRWEEAVAAGYKRLDTGLTVHAIRLFEPSDIEPELAMAPITVSDAIRIVRVHDRRLREAERDRQALLGCRPLGRTPRAREG